MTNLEVELTVIEEQTIFGLSKPSNDRTVAEDVKALSAQYHRLLEKTSGEILPFFVLSRNYDEAAGDFELSVGGLPEAEGLEKILLPAGKYAKIAVKPKLRFLWGPAIGEAKRFLYTKWLPASGYEALNLEYEFHTGRSMGKNPSIDLYFAIKDKNPSA